MTTKYKLAIIREGYRVVPEEPTDEMIQYVRDDLYSAEWIYKDMLSKAPPLDTPPVLRWEGESLIIGSTIIATAFKSSNQFHEEWLWRIFWHPIRMVKTKQEARRAVEKALGFPDGLVIDESN